MIKVPASCKQIVWYKLMSLDHIIVNHIVEGEFILDIKHKTVITFAASIAIQHSKDKFFITTWPCNKLYTWHFFLYDSWQCKHKKLTCEYCWELVEGLFIHSFIHSFIYFTVNHINTSTLHNKFTYIILY